MKKNNTFYFYIKKNNNNKKLFSSQFEILHYSAFSETCVYLCDASEVSSPVP